MMLRKRNQFTSSKKYGSNSKKKTNIMISIAAACNLFFLYWIKSIAVGNSNASNRGISASSSIESNKSNNVTPMSKDSSSSATTSIDYKHGAFAKFPTMLDALPHAEIVGIYFAAPYAQESEQVTQDLDEAFSYYGFLLSPLDLLSIEMNLPEAKDILAKRRNLAIIYVSSNSKSTLDDLEYGSEEWLRVSRETDEGASLKRYFHTCSKQEESTLNMIKNKKCDIPHLVIIDSFTQDILTEDGVKDIKANAPHAYEIWQELQKERNRK